MDDGSDETDSLSSMLPDFDQRKFHNMDETLATAEPSPGLGFGSKKSVVPVSSTPTTDDAPRFPEFAPPAAPAPAPPASTTTTTDNHNKDLSKLSMSKTSSPVLAGPIKLNTNLGPEKPPIEELKATQLGVGLGGLWGIPPLVGEADRFRDRTQTKRRWTVNERA